jgi:hypothetical protein
MSGAEKIVHFHKSVSGYVNNCSPHNRCACRPLMLLCFGNPPGSAPAPKRRRMFGKQALAGEDEEIDKSDVVTYCAVIEVEVKRLVRDANNQKNGVLKVFAQILEPYADKDDDDLPAVFQKLEPRSKLAAFKEQLDKVEAFAKAESLDAITVDNLEEVKKNNKELVDELLLQQNAMLKTVASLRHVRSLQRSVQANDNRKKKTEEEKFWKPYADRGIPVGLIWYMQKLAKDSEKKIDNLEDWYPVTHPTCSDDECLPDLH